MTRFFLAALAAAAVAASAVTGVHAEELRLPVARDVDHQIDLDFDIADGNRPSVGKVGARATFAHDYSVGAAVGVDGAVSFKLDNGKLAAGVGRSADNRLNLDLQLKREHGSIGTNVNVGDGFVGGGLAYKMGF